MNDFSTLAKRYDISMLRDFLDHLLCELRLAQLEFHSKSNGAPKDLTSLQEIYRNKYHTTGLLEVCTLENDVESAAEFETARELFASMFSDLRGVEIKRLEELQGLFDEALRSCAQDENPVRIFSAAELLASSEVDT